VNALDTPYHDGELEVQRRAGVREEADDVGGIVNRTISAGAARFLASQRMAVAATLDAGGQPWASLLTGPPGFLHPIDESLLHIGVAPVPADPLAAHLTARPELALLVLDPATRRRMRLNGRGLLRPDGLFLLPDQVYGNCPKYIQKRRLVAEVAPAPPAVTRATRLDERQRAAIARADTFFIATFHPQGGADASHRGGRPGFVRVLYERRLTFLDYAGNNMFNTLGNLDGYPRAGLLFVDFENGDLLQLAGKARLRWAPQRHVELEVAEVVESRGGSPLRWELLEYSPSNP
jgi:predicted pyridoxine 5'-phosphate oxidase superfamily flavin-nucleotide-binding protein